MSHDALARTNKGKKTQPNSWFVGMAPRRNPDIVVCVLWENGDWGSNSAKLAAQVITAYVDKQRKQSGNLRLDADAEPAPRPGLDAPADAAAKPGTPKPDAPKPAASTSPKPKQPEPAKPVAGLTSSAAQEPIRTP